jgi:hypothetical protein
MHPSSLSKHGWNPEDWILVADDSGVPLGKFKVPFQPAQVEVDVIRKFLIRIKVEQQEERMSKTEKVNMVWLAGTVKLDPKSDDNGVRCLIDVGLKNAIPCGVKKSDDGLAVKLERFRQGDFIKVVAILDPYGVKQADGTWKNGMAVRLTEIKNEPPKRAAQPAQQSMSDDDIPF